MEIYPNITDLSHELLCQILEYLPLREILSVAMLCKKMSTAVDMHLRLCKSIDFCQDAICGYMPSSITDDHLLALLRKCPQLETVYGLHPIKIERRRLRKRSALTIPGIIEALSLCRPLRAIETSDLRLFEAIMQHLPQLEIIGHFQNRDGLFPPQASQRLKLQPYPRISSLHLIGVEVPELTAMPLLQHLHLQCVRFTKLQPFRAFLAQNLKSFVMKHCIGPSVPQRYLSLIIALSSSPNLSHLELVRVPLLNGLFQRAVEDSYRHNGFVNLKTLVIAGCKGILEADLGHLMIVSSKTLETLYVQPSLTKDSLFVSLSYAQCSFPKLQNLHLGYVDNLNSSGEWSNDTLISFGLAEVPDTPSSITDSGMKVISQLFPYIKTLCVSNCPHLMVMYHWMSSEDLEGWSKLTDLTLQKCHCLQLSSFALFISFLRNIEIVILNDMFREPPKGCSHVGLSAGTGLGMSSAVVSNQDEHIAVQGHQQDFEHPGDEENEENDREFVDVENDDNPEPQFMVLQRDFFDGDDDAGDADINVEDGQDLEREHNEEHDAAETLPVNNSLNNEPAMGSINSNCKSSKPVSIDNKNNSPSTSSASHSQSIDGNVSRYNLRQSHKKSSKIVHVQNDSSTPNKKKNIPNNEHMSKDDKCLNMPGIMDSNNVQDFDPHKPSTSKAGRHLDYSETCDMKPNNECNSEKDKILVKPEVINSNYVQEYDPHKPSTSKAGKHLDYSVTCDTKQCDIYNSESDSEYKYGSTSKQLKKSLNKQCCAKKVKKSNLKNLTENKLSLEANTVKNMNGDGSAEIENSIHASESFGNCITDSFGPSNNMHSFSDEDCKLDLPGNVPDTKYQGQKTFSEISNSCTKISDVKPEPQMYSSSENNFPVLTAAKSDHSDFKLENRNNVLDGPCTPKEISGDFTSSNISNDNREELSKIPISKKSETGISKQDPEEINPSITDEHTYKSSMEYKSYSYNTEKLKVKTHSTLANNIEKAPENRMLKINDGNSSENLPYNNFPHKVKSEDKNVTQKDSSHLKTGVYDSVVKSEDESACCSSSFDLNNESTESNHLNCFSKVNRAQIDTLPSKPKDEIHSNNCESSIYDPEKMCNRDSVHTASNNENALTNSFNNSFRKNEIEVNNCYQNKKLKTEVKIDNTINTSHNLIQNDVAKSSGKVEPIVSDDDCDSMCINIEGSENKILGENKSGASKISNKNEFPVVGSDNLYEVKPCCVLVTKINKIPPCMEINCNNQSEALLNKSDLDESVPLDKNVCTTSENSENLGIYNHCQASTSKAAPDIYNSCSVKLSRCDKRTKSSYGCETCTVIIKNEHEKASPSSMKNEIRESEMQNVNEVPKNEICENDSLKLSPKRKRLKKSSEDHSYYVVVSKEFPRNVKIVSSSTGQSHLLPDCRVLISQNNSKNFFKSKVKTKCKSNTSEKLNGEHSEMSLDYDPYLPSTSRDQINNDNASEKSKYTTIKKNCTSLNCSSSDKGLRGKTSHIMESQKKIKESNKCFNTEIKESANDNIEGSKKEKTAVFETCKDFADSSDHKIEKLQITDSDAALLIKRFHTGENNLHNGSACYCYSNTTNDIENNFINFSPNEGELISKSTSVHQITNTASKNSNLPSSSGNGIKSVSHSGKKTRRKKITTSKKRVKRHSNQPPVKSSSRDRFSERSMLKRIMSGPMISLVSQGTQATSADIRRSVRRIRRATAHTRRAISSLHVSRNSSHPSKISAKMLHKVPPKLKSRPELVDKATSTSDPLLEEDAVQTLLLASDTLLSFTVVSCGISDLIIDRCPKLFHVEVQACRILKKIELNTCPSMKKLNVSQCPKLNICALVAPVISLSTDSYFLVSYEPCMQGYHPGDGEKAILSRAVLNQSVLICHDFNDVSCDGLQAKFKEKLIKWLSFLSTLYLSLNYSGEEKSKIKVEKVETSLCSGYPWSHDIQKMHGQYTYSPSSDFCITEGRYQLATNNSIVNDILETRQTDTGFPNIDDCEAYENNSLLSYEAIEKYIQMEKNFVGFYIPITESNQINVYK